MNKTKTIVFSSLFSALCCVLTMIVKIPSPIGGFINLGDAAVLASGCFLGGGYGFFAAALGSALADVFSGYIIYAPATFIIKGLMAQVMWIFFKKEKRGLIVLGACLAELIMCVGYYIFDGFLYGFIESLINIPANLVQGFFGIVVGLILIGIFKKSKINF